MSCERTRGLRATLSLAPVYRLVQSAVGADRFRDHIVSDAIRPSAGDRVLDIGCGTADILGHLPAVDYVGFDPNPRYIAHARAQYAERGTFVVAGIDEFNSSGSDRTIVIAIGVLHHVEDERARRVLELGLASLAPGGRFVSVDPTLVDDQPRLARMLVRNDRGRHVRTTAGLTQLARSVFPDAAVQVRHDLLRVPYSHAIVVATVGG